MPNAPAQACDKARYHHGNLRSALIEAALRILAQEGVEELGLRRTAREVGCSQTAPYHHFGSKEGLLAAVAARGFQMLAAEQQIIFERPVRSVAESDAKIRALGCNYVRFARTHPELFQLMFGPLIPNRDQYPDLVEARGAGYGCIERATAEHLDQLGTDIIPVKVAVTGAWAMVHGLSQLLNEGKVVAGEGEMPGEEELVDTVLRMIDWSLSGLRERSPD
jgi:AcrR family transcriptional regulator